MAGRHSPRDRGEDADPKTHRGVVDPPPPDSTLPPLTSPRHAPVGTSRFSMNSLNRFRSPLTCRSSTPSASPTFSAASRGSYEISRKIFDLPSPAGSKRTTPAFGAPVVLR